jgi:4-alpha-glucanotransferase
MPLARLPKLTDRTSGVLLHPTSLPGQGENGDLGREARAFVDFLADAAQSWWQALPINPPGYGGSPYSAESAFAGSPGLISIDRLVDDGLLGEADRGLPRQEQLERAYNAFARNGGRDDADFRAFAAEARDWLDDFALYQTIKRSHGNVEWTRWPTLLRDRDLGALALVREERAHDVDAVRFQQWRFARDWRALHTYAHERGVGLIGDLPIFMAHDSADVWAHRDLFHLDSTGAPALVAGVPPDYFAETGQRWGNPLYRWGRMREDGYHWWVERFRATLGVFDAVRLDHFIGFVRYWEIPGHEATAQHGHWRTGPGAALFNAVAAALGELPMIAEDLGEVTPAVHALRDQFGFPGLKILEFAFGTDPNANDFLPHNYPRNAVAYTGTHDNDTTVGWFFDPGSGTRSAEQTDKERRTALHYLGLDQETDPTREIHWKMIRMVMMSVANVALIPVQDLLGLGGDARMNYPGTSSGNWSFRVKPGALTPELAGRLRDLTVTYGRAPAR